MPANAPDARRLDAVIRKVMEGSGPDGLAAFAPRPLPGVAPYPSLIGEAGVVASALLAIGSVPGLPLLLIWLWCRARKAETGQHMVRWSQFAAVAGAVVVLATVPVLRRPRIMQSRLWRWWLEYMSVRVAYRSGEPLPDGQQYLFLMMPHGLYPFSGACATISKMVETFFNMRIAVAPAALRLPIIRHLMGWIGCVSAEQASIRRALANGDNVGLYPGGIAEMVRTVGNVERLVLLKRKGFVRAALEQGISIVPVFVFGQSVVFGQLPLPTWVETLSRWLRASIVLPYGRFGLLVPRHLPLLYAIGAPIACPRTPSPTPAQVDEVHAGVVAAVQELYDFYKGIYGWGDRPLSLE